MFDDNNLIDKILQQANAALILRSAQDQLEKEQKKRTAFYQSINEKDKVEFIKGEAVYHSPVLKKHNDATRLLLALLDIYNRTKQAGYVGFEKIMVQFTRNDYEPDICFFSEDKARGFNKNQMFFPVPDFIVEVLSKSPKSLKRDKEIKYNDYEAHGVKEYWMIDPDEEMVEQHILTNGKYELKLKASEGNIASHVLNDFTIPIKSIFDEEINLATIRNLLKE